MGAMRRCSQRRKENKDSDIDEMTAPKMRTLDPKAEARDRRWEAVHLMMSQIRDSKMATQRMSESGALITTMCSCPRNRGERAFAFRQRSAASCPALARGSSGAVPSFDCQCAL